MNFTAAGAQARQQPAELSIAMNTTLPAVPAPSSLVEMTGPGGPVGGVRVDAVADGVLTLSPPRGGLDAARPAPGDQVVLRWPAGPRGRYAMAGTVVGAVAADRLQVRAGGEPQIEQDRHYVRGGGGEQVRMRLPEPAGAAQHSGWICDISERGVRAHFAAAPVAPGDPLCLQIDLDADTVDLTGTVLKLSVLEPEDDSDPTRIEVVAVFEADEAQAQIIRRYVLRHQLLTRLRTAGE